MSSKSSNSFLIKEVVHKLKRKNEGLERFVTLSPVPGFVKWLKEKSISENIDEEDLLKQAIIYFLYSEKAHWSVWPSVLACVIGGYFLSDFNNSSVRFGDTLVITGAIFWALHIIYIGKIIERFDLPFFIALTQNLIVSTLSLILVLLFEDLD